MLLWLVTSSEWEIHQGGFRRKNHNEQRALVYECVKKWRNWKRSNWGYPNTIDSAAKVINFPISFLTIWVILISTSTTRCGCCSKKYVEKTRLYKTTTIFRKKNNMKKKLVGGFSTTHLKNMQPSNWAPSSPNRNQKFKKYLSCHHLGVSLNGGFPPMSHPKMPTFSRKT